MKYRCPNCVFGHLIPTKVTYVRLLGQHLITIPNFAAWNCDACGHTLYDNTALAHVELIFGPDEDTITNSRQWQSRQTEGPGNSGPRRWSF